MQIDLHNYEAFFLDYKEGNLSTEMEKELFLFLETNPHLYEELHAFENVTLEDLAVGENFTNKNSIKKTEFSEETLIAYTEGLLEEKSKKEIDALALQNSALKKDLALYQSTKIQPDLNEKFKNKAVLKKSGAVIIALQNNYTFLRVAAAILLLIGLFFLVNKFNSKNETENKVEVADVNDAPKIQKSAAEGVTVNENKQVAENGIEKQVQSGQKQEQGIKNKESVGSQQLTASNNRKKEVVISPIETNTLIANNTIKNIAKDSSAFEKIFVAENKVKEEGPKIDKSYFNHSVDKDDDENETPVTASVNTGRKSFFQKIARVAKKVNEFGVKNVDAKEQNNSNSLSIGSFVVAETKSY